MGDFEVINVNGRLQKNGGNVASYFCTPEGRVVHAVGKPVQADTLLCEARWALATHRRAIEEAPTDLEAQARIVEAEHLRALNADATRFVSLVESEAPRAKEDYWNALQSHRQSGRARLASYEAPEILRVAPVVTARRRAAERLGGDVAHRMVAAQPLAPLKHVSRRFFERLTGENANERRGLVYSAAAGLEKAREHRRPVLLILYNGRGEHREEFDSAMQRLVTTVLNHPTAAEPLRECAVVSVPIRQLPALSNLADLPVYDLPSGSRPALIVTKATGDRVVTLPGSVMPSELASHIWPEVHASWLARAEKLAADDDHRNALKLLRKAKSAAADTAIGERAARQINDVHLDLAKTWAGRGSTQSALRMFHRVRANALRPETRSLAEREIVELGGSL